MGRTKADSAASTVPAGFPREPLPPLLCLATMHPGAAAKNPPVKAGDAGDAGSIRGWGRSPGGGNGNPLWYSCLENPMDRGAWQATVRGVAKSQTRLSPAHTHTPPSTSPRPPHPLHPGLGAPVFQFVHKTATSDTSSRSERNPHSGCTLGTTQRWKAPSVYSQVVKEI